MLRTQKTQEGYVPGRTGQESHVGREDEVAGAEEHGEQRHTDQGNIEILFVHAALSGLSPCISEEKIDVKHIP
jgi:hypothetical protein